MGSEHSDPYNTDSDDDLMEEDESTYSYSDDEEPEDEDENEDTDDEYGIDHTKESVIIPTRVADLEEMASLNVAISLWNHLNIPTAISKTNEWVLLSKLERLLFDKVLESTNKLPVPKPVIEHIGKYVTKMRNEIKEWISYHFRRVFFNCKSDHDGYTFIYDIVWYSNGTINYKETARSLLNSPSVSDVKKYHLLSTYCLKDDIDRMSPSVFSNNSVVRVPFSDNPMIFYWNCYYRNELGMIPKNAGESIEYFMVKCRHVDNWPAKEYFFDRLSSDEQVQIASWLIEKYGITYLKLLMMKLNESQRLHLYMDRAVKIMSIYARTRVHHEDILTTWSEIRNLITPNQFASIFKKMLEVPNYEIVKDIWASASDNFKHHLLSCSDQYEIVENVLRSWVLDNETDFFFTMMKDADTNLKTNITKKRCFIEVCEKLISNDELKLLDRILNSCFDDVRELQLFKQGLAKEDFFGNHCIKLIRFDNEPQLLERFFNSFLPDPEELARFKRELTKKEYFRKRCQYLIGENDSGGVAKLLDVCFTDIHELTRFKKNFTEEEFFANHCAKLIIDDKYQQLTCLFNLFLPQTEDSTRFKHQLTTKEFFSRHCEQLMYNDQLQMLDYLLNSFLLNAKEVLIFKRDLVLKSTKIRSRCVDYYSDGNFKLINMLLNRFMSPYPELILEYKKNLLTSSDILSKSIELFDTKPDVLNNITADGFITTDMAAELIKRVMFSPSVILKIQLWIRNGRVNIAKERINQFLTADEDRKTLKMQVVGNPAELVRNYFFKNDLSVWQTLMLWWLENETAVREYKRTMPVDEIFDDILMKCVFETYNATNRRYCKFRLNFDLVPLTRFSCWYFETPAKVKEYKLLRIDSYMTIETIRTLLKKTDTEYLKEVLGWFFEKDTNEIAKFKMKNRGRKILKYFDV